MLKPRQSAGDHDCIVCTPYIINDSVFSDDFFLFGYKCFLKLPRKFFGSTNSRAMVMICILWHQIDRLLSTLYLTFLVHETSTLSCMNYNFGPICFLIVSSFQRVSHRTPLLYPVIHSDCTFYLFFGVVSCISFASNVTFTTNVIFTLQLFNFTTYVRQPLLSCFPAPSKQFCLTLCMFVFWSHVSSFFHQF